MKRPGRATFALSLSAVALCLAMMAIGGLTRAQGGPLECPEWPLCEGTAIPVLRGRVLIEFGHRVVANVLGLNMLALAMALAWRMRAGSLRHWRLGVAGVVAVVVQGALISRAGVLVSIQRRLGGPEGMEPQVLVVLTGLFAVAVLALAAWLTLRSGDRLAAMGLVACELVETLSTLGAALVFFGRPPAVVLVHSLASIVLIGFLAWVGAALWAERERSLPASASAGGPAAGRVLAGVVLVVVLGHLVRHTDAGTACGTSLLGCGDGLVPGPFGRAWLLQVHRGIGVIAASAAAWAAWSAVRAGGNRAGAFTGACLLALVPLQVGLGAMAVLSGLDPSWRTLHHVVGEAVLALVVAHACSLRPAPVAAPRATIPPMEPET